MRPELTTVELIEKYLSGELNAADKKLVEDKINSDANFRNEVEAQKKIVESVKQNALKNSISKSYKKQLLKTKLFKGGATFLIVTLAIVTAVFIYKNSGENKNNIRYELNEKSEKIWANADKNIAPEIFDIDNTKDTVIETKGGMVLAIPSGCFKNSKGEAVNKNVELEIKEALDAATILTSGLSTMSGDQPLETGGMFYLNARQDGENLSIDKTKPISANIPTAEKKPNMLLFEGQRRSDGTIDWANPKPLEKNLNTVNILSLNFYPPKYEDSLARWGYDRNDKRFKDSLYYSFAGMFDSESMTKNNSPVKPDSMMLGMTDTLKIMRLDPLSGKKIFKTNCSSCHKFSSQLTGPALQGLYGRVPSKDWLKRFIRSSAAVIKSGDPYAAKLVANNGGVNGMSEFGFLSDQELNDLIAYLPFGMMNDDSFNGGDSTAPLTGINPAKIKTIWDKKYSGTILATKEFEERLKVIHKTYNETILMLYVNNLDKPLWQIDSMAVNLAEGNEREKFIEFAKRKEGGVKINSGLQTKLSDYFNEKEKAYTEAATKTMKKFYEENADAQQKFDQKSETHQNNLDKDKLENYNRELEINLKEAYRQIGKPYPTPPPPPGYYSAPITNAGWNNLDRYVIESTTNRTTLDYTDPKSGKKAIIRYEPITVEISNTEKFDNVFAYLLPDSLNSFMMMKSSFGVFRENLNELFNYDLIVIGMKGNEKYIYHKQVGIRGTITQRIDLKKVTETDFKRLTRDLNRTSSAKEKMEKEIEFRISEQKNFIRQKKFEKTEELRTKTMPFIFKNLVQPEEGWRNTKIK